MARASRLIAKYIKRLIYPLLLAIAGVLLMTGSGGLPLSEEITTWMSIGGGVFVILAIGWGFALIVDWRFRRAIRSADVTAADNLEARKLITRINVLRRISTILIAVLTMSLALMAIPPARQVGLSLFASAGVAGLVVGIAAQPVLSNLIAGLQIAFTQPIRIDDVVIVEGEWGWIERIEVFHVIVRIWDERRLVVPLTYFIQKPFQNWTRESAQILGTIYWHVDYRAPVEDMRKQVKSFCEHSKYWDGRVCSLLVTDAKADSIEVRALASARNSTDAWELRCEIREKMIGWLQSRFPESLPRQRAEAYIRSEPHVRPERQAAGA